MIDQHNSLAEKFLRKGFWLYLFSFIIGPIWYTVKIIISSELTVSEVWILYWIISLMNLLSAYNDLWMTESLNHFIPKFITEKRYDKVKSILTFAFLSQIITWITLALFFFFWADFISNHYFNTSEAVSALKIFSLFFLWINIFQLLSTFFISIQNTFYNKLIDLFRMWFVLISTIFVFSFDLSSLKNFSYSWVIWLYIWIIVATFLFFKKYYLIYFKNEKILWNKILFKTIFKYALFVLLWAQAWTILSQMDMQIIIYILWATDAWYYTNYLSIIWIPYMIIWPVFLLLFPIFSELHSKWEFEKIKLIKSIFVKIFISVWLAFNFLFFIFSEKITFILFWEKFIKSWIILKYSILFLVFNFLLQINFTMMAWIWKVKERVKIIITAILFNFITNIIFINLIWVYWSALATWIWWILIYVMSEKSLWEKFKIKYDYKFIFKNIWFILFLALINFYFILPLFNNLTRLNSFYLMVITSIIYFWIFVWFNYNEFKIFIWEVKKIKK